MRAQGSVHMHEHKLVTIASYTDAIEANLVKGRLESEGIPVFLLNDHQIWANWMLSNALGGVKLQVTSPHVTKAKAIVADHQQGKFDIQVNDITNQCPRCDSAEFREVKTSWRIAFLGLFMLNIPIPYARGKWKCKSCGYVASR